jgi:hypothetical protein
MSKLKISEDLFLEKQELNRLVKFLAKEGHKREFLLSTKSFGIFPGELIPDSLVESKDSFLVENANSNNNQVFINPGKAVDSNGEIIHLVDKITRTVPNDNLWYWIKISYQENLSEIGTVSINGDGLLVGIGTKFKEVLRGQPNFTSKIRFTNSNSGNIFEYEVVEVIDDENVVLSGGGFIAESNLKYTVIGTFTPGFIPSNPNKSIFVYDDCKVEFIPEDIVNSAPAKNSGLEFYLARVKSFNQNVLVQDKRNEFWKSRSEFELTLLEKEIQNPIIGVESVKWDVRSQAGTKNEVNLAFGLRSSNWTIDPTQNKLTIATGVGGVLKMGETDYFEDADFDGWKVYTPNGKHHKIYQSEKTGGQINLYLEYMDPDSFISSEQVLIVPDIEEIEILVRYDFETGIINQLEETFSFPANTPVCKMYLRIIGQTPYYYNLKYRYRNQKEYTDWVNFPDKPTWHYTEKAFEQNGILKDGVILNTYEENVEAGFIYEYNFHVSDGFIQVVPNANNYEAFVDKIDLGDLLGVEVTELDNNVQIKELVVGRDRQYQYFVGDEIQFSQNLYIDIKNYRVDGSPCRNGNHFYLHFKQKVSPESFTLGFKLRIIQNFVSLASFDILKIFEEIDIDFLNTSVEGIWIRVTYDGDTWFVNHVNEIDVEKRGTIKMFAPVGDQTLSDCFNQSNGLGKVGSGWYGWALADGRNNTIDMRSRIPVGRDERESAPGGTDNLVWDSIYNLIGNQVGLKNIALSRINIPPHKHTFIVTGVNDGGTSEAINTFNNRISAEEYKITNLTSLGGRFNGQWGASGSQLGDSLIIGNTGDGTDNVGEDTEESMPLQSVVAPIDIRQPSRVIQFVQKIM